MLYNMTHNGSRKIIFILGKGELLNDHVLNEHKNLSFLRNHREKPDLENTCSQFP